MNEFSYTVLYCIGLQELKCYIEHDYPRAFKKIDFLVTGKRYQFKNVYTCFLYPGASYIERV